MKTIQVLKQLPFILFVSFWLVTILLYFPAHNAMLIDDGVNAIEDLKRQGWSGLFHSYNFDSFYQGYYLLLNIFYGLFKLNALGWFMVYSFIHALNALLIFKFIRSLLGLTSEFKHQIQIAFFCAIFFLLSPYNAENIVWAATTHYIVSLSILLFSCNWLISFFQNGYSNKGLFLFLLLNIFSLVTFELSFFFPIIYFALFFLLLRLIKSEQSFKSFFLKIISPLGVAIVFYLFALHFVKHTWIPHAGETSQLNNSFAEIIKTQSKHLVKLFSFVHYQDYSIREKVYSACEHWKKAFGVTFLILALILFGVGKKSKSSFYILSFLFLAGFITLLPFCNRAFVYLFKYENLRYSYFTSVFFYAAFVLILFHVHTYIRYLILSTFLLLFLIAIIKTVDDKKTSAIVYHNFINSFPDTKSTKTYLLNTPSYGCESYMFWDRSRLPIALYCYRDIEISKNLNQILFYNALTAKDSFEVEKVNDSLWTFLLKTDGAWLMDENRGAVNYENENYNLTIGEWGKTTIQFKHQFSRDEKFIYFNGASFINLN